MWSLGCANDQMGATKSCAVPDTEAPMIALVQPQDGEVFDEDADPGGGTTVEIVAEAQDAIGVQRVELSFNDEVVNMLTAPPYVWYPKLAKGTYAIRVAAFDYFGNGAGSDEIVISVGSDPDADDGDGSGDSGPGPIVAPQFGKSGCYCRTGTGAPWSTPLVLLVLLSVRRRRLHRNE
jgi:MYXO-CTERM domain-containing protein